MGPAEVVRAVFDAARNDDLDAALPLFAEDCVIRLPEGTHEGREGVREWQSRRAAGAGPRLTAGDPEAVDDVHVLVPLTAQIEMGGPAQSARVTGIWTVIDGLVTEVRAIPGGRTMALGSLSSVENPRTPETDSST